MFHETEYGDAVSSAPRFAPSTLNCTPTTPTLSLALAATVIVLDTVAPPAGAVTETAGATVSLNTVTVTAADVLALPAASRATAVNVCEPLVPVVVVHETAYGAVVSNAPMFTPSRRNWTLATPTLSDAVALTVTVPPTVAPAAGAEIATAGAVLSSVVNVKSPDTAALAAASRERTR